ncbi:hypothetical protein MIT9_P2066 [Methylomarinovum caldicuralii]|uniref:Uncharacterized protein n=1 Tax=Methylomarinovum caldicuralii TaxID=438856 RepID=A0AAU9C1A3_9GAMM|nr:hypothetical protein [Methylomarinovum caldicuralii]BCX82480.1 hypothetical protein MIT9_P2066 [Methylomarinovum caldicuralii]
MMTKKITWRDWLPDWKSLGKIVFYVALLYVLQVFVILPFMTYVIDSDFLSPRGAFEPVSGDAKQGAQLQCSNYFRQEMTTERVEFPLGGTKVWGMGDGRFLVKARAIVTDDAELAHKINYACYVKFEGGDAFEAGNWTLRGLDWRDANTTE